MKIAHTPGKHINYTTSQCSSCEHKLCGNIRGDNKSKYLFTIGVYICEKQLKLAVGLDGPAPHTQHVRFVCKIHEGVCLAPSLFGFLCRLHVAKANIYICVKCAGIVACRQCSTFSFPCHVALCPRWPVVCVTTKHIQPWKRINLKLNISEGSAYAHTLCLPRASHTYIHSVNILINQ